VHGVIVNAPTSIATATKPAERILVFIASSPVGGVCIQYDECAGSVLRQPITSNYSQMGADHLCQLMLICITVNEAHQMRALTLALLMTGGLFTFAEGAEVGTATAVQQISMTRLLYRSAESGGLTTVQQNCYFVTDQVVCGQDCTTHYVVQGGVRVPVRDCRPRYCPHSRRVCK
jgi:hypothetical protein